MNEWLKVPKLYLTLIIVLVVGILGTHFADSAYYNNKIDSQVSQDINQEKITYNDFDNLADLTIFAYANINPDCNQFKDGADRGICVRYEQSKQGLEEELKSGKTLGQILSEGGQ